MIKHRYHPCERDLVKVKEQSLSEGIFDVGVVVVSPIGVRCSAALRTLSRQPDDLSENRLTNMTHNHTAASIALDEATVRFEEQNEVFGICEDKLIAARHNKTKLKERLDKQSPIEEPENLTPQIENLQSQLDDCEIQSVALYNLKVLEEAALMNTEVKLIDTMTGLELEIEDIKGSIRDTSILMDSTNTRRVQVANHINQLREQLQIAESNHNGALEVLCTAQQDHQISRQQHADCIINCEASLNEALEQVSQSGSTTTDIVQHYLSQHLNSSPLSFINQPIQSTGGMQSPILPTDDEYFVRTPTEDLIINNESTPVIRIRDNQLSIPSIGTERTSSPEVVSHMLSEVRTLVPPMRQTDEIQIIYSPTAPSMRTISPPGIGQVDMQVPIVPPITIPVRTMSPLGIGGVDAVRNPIVPSVTDIGITSEYRLSSASVMSRAGEVQEKQHSTTTDSNVKKTDSVLRGGSVSGRGSQYPVLPPQIFDKMLIPSKGSLTTDKKVSEVPNTNNKTTTANQYSELVNKAMLTEISRTSYVEMLSPTLLSRKRSEDVFKFNQMLSPSLPLPTAYGNIVTQSPSRTEGSPAVSVRMQRSCVPPDGRWSLPPPRLPSVMTEEGNERSCSRLPSVSCSVSTAEPARSEVRQHSHKETLRHHFPTRVQLDTRSTFASNRNGMLSPPLRKLNK